MKVILVINIILSMLISCKKNKVSDSDKSDSINNKLVITNPAEITDKKLNLLSYRKICNCGKGSLEVKTDYYDIQNCCA